jgi:hypothetical protein
VVFLWQKCKKSDPVAMGRLMKRIAEDEIEMSVTVIGLRSGP